MCVTNTYNIQLTHAHARQLVDGLHARPATKRQHLASEALRELSECLNLTEILSLVPPHVTGLTMCCSPLMRLIPWNVISIDAPGPDGVLLEAPLVEQYTVKLGPSLTMMEINSTAASKLSQSWGLHRLCCIDGNISSIRETGTEVDCVTDLWSNDDDDYTVLSGQNSIPDVLVSEC